MKPYWILLVLLLTKLSLSFADCPKTLSEWDAWRDSVFAPAPKVTRQEILRVLGSCFDEIPDLRTREQARVCMKNFMDNFHASSRNLETHRMSLDIPDEEYFGSEKIQRALRPPATLVTPEILNAIQSARLVDPASIDEVIRQIHLRHPEAKVLPYDPREMVEGGLVGTFDSPVNPARLLILLDSEEKSQYFQFTLNRDESPVVLEQLSAISVVKKEGGHALVPPQIYFQDFVRKKNSDGGWSVARATHKNSNGNCMACHFSGPIEIHEGGVSQKFKEITREINQVMKTQTQAVNPFFSQEGKGPPSGVGPALQGEDSMRRRPDDFIQQCAATKDASGALTWIPSAESRVRIRNGMNCGTCHGPGKKRGAVWIYAGDPEKFIQKYMVHLKIMPPAPKDLTEEERKGIFSCLKTEYKNLFFEWLKEPLCDPVTKVVSFIPDLMAQSRMSPVQTECGTFRAAGSVSSAIPVVVPLSQATAESQEIPPPRPLRRR